MFTVNKIWKIIILRGTIYINLKKVALKHLMDERFNSSYTKRSKAIWADVAHVYRVLVKNNTPGLKFFNELMKCFTDNQLDYREYFFYLKHLLCVIVIVNIEKL